MTLALYPRTRVLARSGQTPGGNSVSTHLNGPEISRKDLVAAIAALPIGVVAGITGVGGAEYRAPVLLILLRNVRWSIAGNLLAGTIFAVALVILRGALFQPVDTLFLAATMALGAMPGAYAGAVLARRTPARWLKILLAGILAATAFRLLLFESTSHGPFSFGATQAALGLFTGFGIGVISGLLGVAGGEYRIPALILIFGLPAIVAGTLSSLVALPQEVVGFLKHRHLGQAAPSAVRFGLVMGTVGVGGVALGVALLGRTNDATVTVVLALLMLLAAAQIAWQAREPDRIEPPPT